MLFTILVATMFRTTAIVFMAAFLCAAPLMGLVVGKLLGRGIAVSRQLPEVGTSGDVVVGRLMLEQRGRIPTFLVHLRPGAIEGGAQPPLALHGPAEYVIPMLRPGESTEWSPQWRLGRRGVYQLPPVQAGARDPLGLFTATKARTSPNTITILPRPVRVSRLGFCGGTQHGAHAPQAATTTADATDFHGIRTWRPGEAIRRVHWKSTVRTGELHVVEWEEDPGCDLTILFDARSFLPSPSTRSGTRTRARLILQTSNRLMKRWKSRSPLQHLSPPICRKTGAFSGSSAGSLLPTRTEYSTAWKRRTSPCGAIVRNAPARFQRP
jgi:uncharacterized protein (DUF58 family)